MKCIQCIGFRNGVVCGIQAVADMGQRSLVRMTRHRERVGSSRTLHGAECSWLGWSSNLPRHRDS
jgi:hypothetical protein